MPPKPSSPQPNRREQSAAPSQPRSPEADASYGVVVLGGGEAGLAVVHALQDTALAADLALIEPSTYHYKQRAWMEVGTMGADKEQTRSALSSRLPSSVTWRQQRATRIDPEHQHVLLDSDETLEYDYLVVALGTNVLWDRIRGLEDHLGTAGLCSVYGYDLSERTWEMIRDFDGGRAFFTAPSSPYKGGTAPLKILRRAQALWHETGAAENTELFFMAATPKEDVDPNYAELLDRSTQGPLHVYHGYELCEVRPEQREAVFSVTKGNTSSQDVLQYDLLHVVPPMRPPSLLEQSGLAHESGPMKGYLAVDAESLRHRQFPTVFGVGDALGLDAVKTAERAREQAEIVARALRRTTQEE
jgi:sulfide:quinone oxidoreductase